MLRVSLQINIMYVLYFTNTQYTSYRNRSPEGRCQSSLLRERAFTLVPTASAISSICPADSLIVCAVIAWDSRFSTSTSLYSRPRARARCQGTSPDLHQKSLEHRNECSPSMAPECHKLGCSGEACRYLREYF